MLNNPKYQQGNAIITALFVVAVVAVLATALMQRLHFLVNRSQQLIISDQMLIAADGVVLWARDLLQADAQTAQPFDRLPAVFPARMIGEIKLSGSLEDAQSRFNLNSLQDPVQQNAFAKLLLTVVPNSNRNQAQQIIFAIIDWLQYPRGTSDFERYYMQQKPPYRAAHRLFVHSSELRLVQGVTPTLYQALAPYVVALPDTSTTINVNTASAPVLMTLDPAFSQADAQAIISLRQQKPFNLIDAFLNVPRLHQYNILPSMLTVTSQYFLVHAYMQHAAQTLQLLALLQRTQNKDGSKIQVLWQTIEDS